MKKLFAILATLSMLFTAGCNELGNDIPEHIFLGLDKEMVSIGPDGGSVDVVVYSNYKWEISGTSDWCTPSVTSGEANEDGQKVTFSADVAYDNREAIFWFRCANEKIKFTVSQSFKEVIIADENKTFSVPVEGGVAVLNYQTSVECEVIIPEEAKSWITIAPADATRGLVAESIKLNIAKNTTYTNGRSAVVKVVAKSNDELYAEYTIIQDFKCRIEYISNDGKVVKPYQSSAFDASIISNTYNNGIGVIEFDKPITSIGERAFAYCTSLTSVTIPDIVTEIGDNAFRDCSSLTSFYGKFASKDGRCLIVDGVLTSFARAGLTEYTIPDSVTSIGNSAFEDCTSLTIVTIPDSVTSIGEWAFCDCHSLTSITIPDSVTSIGERAFFICKSLESVTIGDSVTEIGRSTFEGCHSLTSATIGDSVTSIGGYAFSHCTSLTSITIPDSVTSIGERAFSYCSPLTSVTIPDSVTSIGDWAFCGCTSLTSFYGKFASKDGRCLIVDGMLNSFARAGLTEYTIPYSVTSIGNWAFCGCTSLKSITIPDSVTKIGNYAFSSCSSLTSITIPDSVTEIGYEAFRDCTSLTSATIGDSVTSIGENAFYYCKSLTSVYCKPTTPPTGGSVMFYSNASGRKIYVPRASVNAYKNAAGWKEYASYIVGYNF